jgi:hypothetical protein
LGLAIIILLKYFLIDSSKCCFNFTKSNNLILGFVLKNKPKNNLQFSLGIYWVRWYVYIPRKSPYPNQWIYKWLMLKVVKINNFFILLHKLYNVFYNNYKSSTHLKKVKSSNLKATCMVRISPIYIFWIWSTIGMPIYLLHYWTISLLYYPYYVFQFLL